MVGEWYLYRAQEFVYGLNGVHLVDVKRLRVQLSGCIRQIWNVSGVADCFCFTDLVYWNG